MCNTMTRNFKYSGAIVLGMHDALVSLTGMIGGLTMALADRKLIILSAVIASVAAGLSMGASCYLAEKTHENNCAVRAGITTGAAYIVTCALLILPYIIIFDTYYAMLAAFAMAVVIIFGCNWFICRKRGCGFWRHAFEMLAICVGVSIVAFAIGEFAKFSLGVNI